MSTYGKAKTDEGHGPGGVGSNLDRNPNENKELNDAPDGPFPHGLGQSGDGGSFGDKAVSFRGAKYYFK